ncbi:MAG: hypothetical protein Q9164_002843 [Protoblastenia rupestris]
MADYNIITYKPLTKFEARADETIRQSADGWQERDDFARRRRLDQLPAEITLNIIRFVHPYDLEDTIADCAPLRAAFNAYTQVCYNDIEDENFACMQLIYGRNGSRTDFQKSNITAALASTKELYWPDKWFHGGLGIVQVMTMHFCDIKADRLPPHTNLVLMQNAMDDMDSVRSMIEQETETLLSIPAALCMACLFHQAPVVELPEDLWSPRPNLILSRRSPEERKKLIDVQSQSTKAELRLLFEHLVGCHAQSLDLLGSTVADTIKTFFQHHQRLRWSTKRPESGCQNVLSESYFEKSLRRISHHLHSAMQTGPGTHSGRGLEDMTTDVLAFGQDPLNDIQGWVSLAEALDFDFDKVSHGSGFRTMIDDMVKEVEDILVAPNEGTG